AAVSAGLDLTVGWVRQAKRVAVVAIDLPFAHGRCRGGRLLLCPGAPGRGPEAAEAGGEGGQGGGLTKGRPGGPRLNHRGIIGLEAVARLAPGAFARIQRARGVGRAARRSRMREEGSFSATRIDAVARARALSRARPHRPAAPLVCTSTARGADPLPHRLLSRTCWQECIAHQHRRCSLPGDTSAPLSRSPSVRRVRESTGSLRSPALRCGLVRRRVRTTPWLR